jgi:colanic acid/amylovoran biosynthesis protein
MLIEVTGVFTNNKGAELMLAAVQEHFAQLGPRVQLAVAPQFGSFDERAKYGLRTKLPVGRVGRSLLAAWLMPASFRSSYGLASERDIDMVLDASGFAFGDQLGPERTERFAVDVARWKRRGKRIVLLPQALGPFTAQRLRSAFVEIMRSVDLVFARDISSLANVEELGVAREKLKLAPDFTNLVQGRTPERPATTGPLALIVPNHRMIEKAAPELGTAYVPTLAE